ncbi:serine/threonine-protein phosphatase 2A 56 kDa regulatory subunit beta isoform [Reticulomyxa filosa]|uniref:Serine/threonine-protein phosphatase 2A 56 kDa regulatory subunit beta isoform n=1 Tax=Reticulomyxa filosa TaxID=46433 RepID=X6MWX0_RETFI|nr:serine/threonine-protein phosphatase 2A 56 kDa regulatory subunit beta isoform [Reticulomyxa filosa]|eukprot:ETO18498.1 serine/threonine-protein phosphatase 2A 56 kDa regulatory subunit beta isoform [Reticulomyxa filosa]
MHFYAPLFYGEQKYLPGSFLQNFIELFASEDERERSYVMMILHKIYGRCLKLRPHIIDLACHYLYRIIYCPNMDHFNGVIELLQIICAIIPGLTVPVKDTWQKFLRNILVPLHKTRGLKKFWEQLTQCCVNYVAKDGEGGSVILGGLLRFWPKQSTQKEEIFVMEVVNIINVLINHQDGFKFESFKPILVAASRQLANSGRSRPKGLFTQLMDIFYRNRNHHNQKLRLASVDVEKVYCAKDALYWTKMQQYLTKKESRERDAEEAATRAVTYGKLPPFPVQSGKDCHHSVVDLSTTLCHANNPNDNADNKFHDCEPPAPSNDNCATDNNEKCNVNINSRDLLTKRGLSIVSSYSRWKR